MPNPDFTKDAQERAHQATTRFYGSRDSFAGTDETWTDLYDIVAEQIRQAEQAAREKAIEDAAAEIERRGVRYCHGWDLVGLLRALKDQK